MRSLSVRVPVLAAAVLAITVLLAVVIAYELLVVAGQGDLDRALLRERDRFEHSLARTLSGTDTDEDGPARLRRAAAEYLALHPPTDSYLVVIRIDGDVLSAAGGPSDLVALRDRGLLPLGPAGAVATVATEMGPARTLTSRVSVDGTHTGLFQVIATLTPIRQDALAEIRRLAVAGVLSLLAGGVLLAVILRRALASLRSLAQATQSIELGGPHARFPEANTHDEVGVLAAELNRMLDRLDAALRSSQELFAATSHELRTPITIALGCIETLASLDKDDPGAAAETLATVRQELIGMGRLVEDLMALARAQTEDFVRLQPVDLVEFFDDLRLRIVGLRMEGLSFGPVPDVAVSGDSGRLGQAILNLLVNARAHNPPGTSVTAGAEVRGPDVALFVRDDGRGIHPDVLKRVFQPFASAPSDSPSDNRASSSGLGLAVVDAIMEAHDGRVEIDSGPGGTTVTLIIPAATAHEASTSGPASAHRQSQSRS